MNFRCPPCSAQEVLGTFHRKAMAAAVHIFAQVRDSEGAGEGPPPPSELTELASTFLNSPRGSIHFTQNFADEIKSANTNLLSLCSVGIPVVDVSEPLKRRILRTRW